MSSGFIIFDNSFTDPGIGINMGLLLNHIKNCSVIALDDLSMGGKFPLEDVGGKLIILTHGAENVSGGLGPGQWSEKLIDNKLAPESNVSEIIFLSCDAGKDDFLSKFSDALAKKFIMPDEGVRGSKGSLYATFGEVEESSYFNLTVTDGANCKKCNTKAKDALNGYKKDHPESANRIEELLDFKGDSKKALDVITWAKALADSENDIQPWWNTSTDVYGSNIEGASCTMDEGNSWVQIEI